MLLALTPFGLRCLRRPPSTEDGPARSLAPLAARAATSEVTLARLLARVTAGSAAPSEVPPWSGRPVVAGGTDSLRRRIGVGPLVPRSTPSVEVRWSVGRGARHGRLTHVRRPPDSSRRDVRIPVRRGMSAPRATTGSGTGRPGGLGTGPRRSKDRRNEGAKEVSDRATRTAASRRRRERRGFPALVSPVPTPAPRDAREHGGVPVLRRPVSTPVVRDAGEREGVPASLCSIETPDNRHG